MGSIVRPNIYVNGTIADAVEANENEEAIYDEFNGGIDDVNIRADAAIQGTKVASHPNGIPTLKINDGAVTTQKIADAPNGVSAAKLNANAVIKDKVKVTTSTKALTGVILDGGGTSPQTVVTGASMTPATPSMANCIPLKSWLSAPGVSLLVNVEMFEDNTGAIRFLISFPFGDPAAPLDLSAFTLKFQYIPVS